MIYIRNNVTTLMLKFDYSNQFGQHHLVKTGVEMQQHFVKRLRFQEPYPGGFHGYENYDLDPTEFSFYAQDKLEFESFIINAGIRYDYVDVKDTRWASVKDPAGFINADKFWEPQGEVATPAKQQLSPRLGISFPITDKTIFYSSYGHFFQIPDYSDMYTSRDPTQDRAIVGNPGIAPQKTVAFEFGLKQQLGEDYSIDVGAYFKDITNLVGSTYLTVFPYEYTVCDNSNSGGVQCFEITLDKRLSQYWFANLNYTYSVAKGNESDPREGFNNYRRAAAVLRPKRVFALDFDRTHVFYGSIGLEFPSEFGPSLAGISPLENISVNAVIRISSGLPYTPQKPDESDQLLIEKNTGRMPPIERVDLRISKYINYSGFKLTVFAIINNLFDKLNARSVWAVTGEAWDAGPTYTRSEDRMKDPSRNDIRRSVQLGIRVDF